jgi:hypothetical protein
MTSPNPESRPYEADADANCRRLFDAAWAELADDGFSRATMARLRRHRRQRHVLLALVWLLAVASPVVLLGFEPLVAVSTQWVQLFASAPAAWAVMVGGTCLLLPALWPEAEGLSKSLC